MNPTYIQNLRSRLNRRVEKLKSRELQEFHFTLVQFWSFLQQSSVLSGILEELGKIDLSIENVAIDFFKNIEDYENRKIVYNPNFGRG